MRVACFEKVGTYGGRESHAFTGSRESSCSLTGGTGRLFSGEAGSAAFFPLFLLFLIRP